MENFGSKLRQARLRKGVTQEWMAQRMHIHRSTYAKYEIGGVDPGVEGLRQIVRILEIDPRDLLE